MNSSKYVENVLKTESNDFSKIGARLIVPRNIRFLHGAFGVCTEATELFEMLEKKRLDLVNLKEEAADICWYLGVLVDEFKFSPEILVQEPTIEKNNSLFFKMWPIKNVLLRRALNLELDILSKNVGLLQDLAKKSLFYGRDLSIPKVEECVKEIAENLANLCVLGDFTMAEMMDSNIKKLAKRFGDIFSEEKALNRDLDAERKILESK
jgi:hypothetical protein